MCGRVNLVEICQMVDVNRIIEVSRRHFSVIYNCMGDKHGMSHVDAVCKLSLKICDKLNKPELKPPAVVAAYCHDMYMDKGPTHNTMAAHWVLDHPEIIYYLLGYRDEKHLKLIASACLEHTGTWKHGYTSLLSQIISTADIGPPALPMQLYKSAYIHGRSVKKLPVEMALEEAITFVSKHHGLDSDRLYPPLYKRVYRAKLEALDKFIAEIDVDSSQVSGAWVEWERSINGRL